jgi:hypothetical protein
MTTAKQIATHDRGRQLGSLCGEIKMLPGLDYIPLAKSAFDLVKGILGALPKDKAAEVGKELEKAEEALKKSEAELAKKLGFRLCRCSWPPPIMLWDKQTRKSICPACGDFYPPIHGLGPLKSGFRG